MRVALISSEFAGLPGSGGIGTYFDHLARGLVLAGCEVEVFTSGSQGDLPERQGVRFHHFGQRVWPEFTVIAGLAFKKAHQEKRFDVLECGEFLAEGVVARKLVPDVALVVRMHSPSIILDQYLDFPLSSFDRVKKLFFQITGTIGAYRRGFPLRPILLEPFAYTWMPSRDVEERNFTASADAVVVMSEEMRRFAEGHWWINPEIISKVPNPYLVERSSNAGQLPGEKTLGFLGRFEPRKGIVELGDALVEILPQFPDWKIRFAGFFAQSEKSSGDLEGLPLGCLKKFPSQVHFDGRVSSDNVPLWLQKLDVFVVPSLWDNFPYVILEAMAAGKAIVATRTGAVPEMLGDAGLIVPVGDVRALRNALLKLMADAELRRNLGDAAKKRFEESFHPDRVMGEILEVYREAIERAKNRRKEF